MTPHHDSVLLMAFGGPSCPEDVRPFLDNVLRGRPVPKERFEEVVRHYEAVGGRSPITRLTLRHAGALADLLRREGPALPVHVGMRFWEPFIADALGRMAGQGLRRAVTVVLAPHPSHASWEGYQEAVDAARAGLGTRAPAVDYADPFFEHPRFIEAIAARLSEALARVPDERRAAAAVVFTAHSIPSLMQGASRYAETVRRTAELASGVAGVVSWSIAYQSRSGRPTDPWLEPDIGESIRHLAQGGARDVVVAPIGFVSDHVEVLYDLDIAARAVADGVGVGFVRAGTVGDHPAFVRMLADLVRGVAARRSA